MQLFYSLFLLSTKYATASNPAITNTASKPGIQRFEGVGAGVDDESAVGVTGAGVTVGDAVGARVVVGVDVDVGVGDGEGEGDSVGEGEGVGRGEGEGEGEGVGDGVDVSVDVVGVGVGEGEGVGVGVTPI